MEPVAFYDTAGSVKHVIEKGVPDAAAIAGRQAAAVYRGRVLVPGIEDEKQNFTRFFLIRKRSGSGKTRFSQKQREMKQPRREAGHPTMNSDYRHMIPRGANKTSIAFHVKNSPGVLFRSLSVFALRDISLSKIESRPMRGRPWEYVFYVDFLRGDDEPARNAMRHLGEVAEFVKVLGIYPSA